jgi:hypothetical protein
MIPDPLPAGLPNVGPRAAGNPLHRVHVEVHRPKLCRNPSIAESGPYEDKALISFIDSFIDSFISFK